MKKLLTTTAIAGSIFGFATAAQAETKIGGALNWDFSTQEIPSTGTKDTGPDGVGMWFELDIKNQVELNNGMTATGHVEKMGNDEFDASLMFNAGNTSFGFQQDDMDAADNDMTPFVGDNHDDQVKDVSYSSGQGSVHGAAGFALVQKVGEGKIIALYTPNNKADEAGNNDEKNHINEASDGSGYEIGYNGGVPGVDGLKVNVAYASRSEADESVAGTEDQKATTFGANYNFGQVTVGFNYTDFEGNQISGDDDRYDEEHTGLGAVFAVNDNVSLGVARTKVEWETAASKTADEEITSISLGYNLGPVTVAATHYQMEGASGETNNDSDGFHLTSTIKF